MAPDRKSRIRVERLLRHEFRPDDLTGLFLFDRDHCDGREAVAEIGHFVAHHHERDKGIVTRATRDWFAVARYFARPNPGQIDGHKLPSTAPDYFRIAANRIDPRYLRNKKGLRQRKAAGTLTELAKRLSQNADGTWSLPTDCTETELDLVECVSSVMVVKPAFEASRLVEDFIATLRSNQLITREEIREHRGAIREVVELYAVAAMHNCIVQIGDGSTVPLEASASDNRIEVRAAIPFYRPNGNRGYFSGPMFVSELQAANHCDQDLLAHRSWDFEIEVNAERRLCVLR